MSMSADEDPDDIGGLLELRAALAGHGIAVDDPAEGTPVCFRNVRGAWCEFGLRRNGEVTWTYLPAEDLDPAHAVRMALALLAPDAAPVPGRELPLPDAAPRMLAASGRVLTAAGMTAEPAGIDYGDGEVIPALLTANPAGPARGQVQISGEGEFLWAFRFTRPGSPAGLSPCDVAGAVASALRTRCGSAGRRLNPRF